MNGWDTVTVVEYHPDKVSDALVFRGTRVPVAALFETWDRLESHLNLSVRRR
jgi:hypothetical protein